ncbi:hypothetical protein E6O75_ATG09718 [Venturia nashicola]|uniref:DUF7896 domain-containing protein n=1 Tax=Venturia nashicola TaxID=86259 RepID=A0A4Z1NZD6_9PEZI|nr:hypothetical protein E6O75_ATG09718 [Venturia nashicola]
MDLPLSPSDPAVQQAAHEYRQKYAHIPANVFAQALQMQSSTSLPASTNPLQSQSMSSSDMGRRHSAAVDASAVMQARLRDSSQQYQPQPNLHADNWYGTEGTSSTRQQPRHIPGLLMDIQEYTSQRGAEIDMPSYSPNFSQQQYDNEWLSPVHQSPHYTYNSSPTDTSSLNTPSTPFTTTSNHSPTTMSPNCSVASSLSIGHPLQNDLAMLRVNSSASHFSHSRSQSGADLSVPSTHSARSPSNSHAQLPSPHTSRDLNSPQFPTSNHQFVSSSQPSFNNADVSCMARSDSSSSNSSTSSSQSRISRRSHEISQHAQRDLAPKESDPVDVVKMKRVQSGDGSYKNKAEIPRESQNYKRPQHPKLYCSYCSDHPDGFRGDHELQRHVSRAHPMGHTRKVWVCIDASKDGKPFLQNCKACRTEKKYGAYYNAAAHLRRAHFNPRKRGRKAKGEAEKRGGKGGGSWPPMDELKEHWIREVEEVVPPDSKTLSKDDEELDQPDSDNDEELDSPSTNLTSLIGAAFDNNIVDAAAQKLSFDFIQLDNSHSVPVDTADLVNFNSSPFASALEMPGTGYDVMSQVAGMSDFTAQHFGDVNTYQPAFDENFSQHLVSQESALYLHPNNQMWS